jgi:hypothetical protein
MQLWTNSLEEMGDAASAQSHRHDGGQETLPCRGDCDAKAGHTHFRKQFFAVLHLSGEPRRIGGDAGFSTAAAATAPL